MIPLLSHSISVCVSVRKINMWMYSVPVLRLFSHSHPSRHTAFACSVLFHDSLPAVLSLLKGEETTVWELFVCVAVSYSIPAVFCAPLSDCKRSPRAARMI